MPVQAVTDPKIVLFWTYCFWGNFIKMHRMASVDVECSKHKHKCLITDDRKYFSKSSAVIFHTVADNLMTDHAFLLSLKRPCTSTTIDLLYDGVACGDVSVAIKRAY